MFIQFLFAQMFPVSGARSVLIMLPDPWALCLTGVFIARIKTGRRNQMPISLQGTSRNWPGHSALTHELITTIQKR